MQISGADAESSHNEADEEYATNEFQRTDRRSPILSDLVFAEFTSVELQFESVIDDISSDDEDDMEAVLNELVVGESTIRKIYSHRGNTLAASKCQIGGRD
jgi:hypothetical protein